MNKNFGTRQEREDIPVRKAKAEKYDALKNVYLRNYKYSSGAKGYTKKVK